MQINAIEQVEVSAPFIKALTQNHSPPTTVFCVLFGQRQGLYWLNKRARFSSHKGLQLQLFIKLID
jgi:hypothetical protein